MTANEAIAILIDTSDKFIDVEDWRAADETDALLCLCYEAEPQDICTREFEERVRAYAWAAE